MKKKKEKKHSKRQLRFELDDDGDNVNITSEEEFGSYDCEYYKACLIYHIFVISSLLPAFSAN